MAYQTRDKALQALRNLPATERYSLMPHNSVSGWVLGEIRLGSHRHGKAFRAGLGDRYGKMKFADLDLDGPVY